MNTLFISDLHLNPERPEMVALFRRFMRGPAREADALYILGDLFDYWIGDDDQTPFHQQVISEIRNLTDSGTPCYFIAGNRDFMIGRRFARESGIKILPEPSVIDLYGQPTVLLHGDTLCTNDKAYLRFRKIIRNPVLLSFLRHLPLSLRRKLARHLQSGSKTQQPLTQAQLERMDATHAAVEQTMQQHECRLLIHGHTHRPATHQHPTGTRIVLGDWYQQGSVLISHKLGLSLCNRIQADGYPTVES